MKVPQYESNVREARNPNASIDVKPSVEAFGGGSANLLTPIAATAKLFAEEKRKADDSVVDEKLSELTKYETERIYGPDGTINKKGKNAFGEIDGVDKDFKTKIGEIAKSLGSDYQKEKFQKKANDVLNSVNRTTTRHVGTEIIRHDNEVASSLIKNEMDVAISAYNDPTRINQALNTQAEALNRIAKNNGWSKEEYDNKLNEIRSKTHSGIIERYLVNDQDMVAEEYFKSVKDTISGDELTNIEKKLEVGTLRGKSQRFVDQAINEGLSESKALERARQEQDPKLRDTYYDRIKMEYGLRDSAKREQLEKLHINALNMIDSGKIQDLTKAPGWTGMTDGQRSSLINYAKAKVSGKNIQTDYDTYYNLKTMAATPETQDKFLRLNLMEYRDKLDNGDFEKMINLQTEARKGTAKGKKELDGFRTDAIVVKQAYEAAGLKVTNKEKLNAFNSRVEQAQIAAQERLGRKLTNTELAELANTEAKTVVVKEGWLFDDKKKMFELSEDEIKNIRYKDVPSSDKVKIETVLRNAKKQVTEEAVRQLYIQKVLNGRN